MSVLETFQHWRNSSNIFTSHTGSCDRRFAYNEIAVVWAQRTDEVSLTVDLPDSKSFTVKVEPKVKFTLSASAGLEYLEFELNLQLFETVNVEFSEINFELRQSHPCCSREG